MIDGEGVWGVLFFVFFDLILLMIWTRFFYLFVDSFLVGNVYDFKGYETSENI